MFSMAEPRSAVAPLIRPEQLDSYRHVPLVCPASPEVFLSHVSVKSRLGPVPGPCVYDGFDSESTAPLNVNSSEDQWQRGSLRLTCDRPADQRYTTQPAADRIHLEYGT